MTEKPKPKGKPGSKFNRGGYLKDARKARVGEVIGGGFFVFRRGDSTNRIRPSMWPYEHGTLAEAHAQAETLAKDNPKEKFIVVSQVSEVGPLQVEDTEPTKEVA